MNCRLCDSSDCNQIFRDDVRSYRLCGNCGLIFVPVSEHVSVEEEKKRYDLHENSADHEGYLRFLNECADVIVKETPVSARILDYGSGRNAVLTRLLRDRGYDCTAYDPLYGIGKDALEETYDAVVLCEVVEHIRDLKKELVNIKNAAGISGKIFIRTQLYPSLENFPQWWYRNDITHINFFSGQSIAKLATLLGRPEVQQQGEDIFILRKGNHSSPENAALTGRKPSFLQDIPP
jgi:hypothetical protein